MSRPGLSVLALTLLLGACGTTEPPKESFDILSSGQPVPLIVNQALSVGHRLEWGLTTQNMGNSHLYSIESNDLKGYPFVRLIITAPVQFDDVWQLVASVDGNEWNPLDESSAWTTTLTGSTTVRDTLIVSNVGLSVPMKMYKTIQAMGGLDKLKEVVAVDLQTFVMRDTGGTLWNLETRKPLTAEELDLVTSNYNEIYNAANTPQVAELMKNQWEKFLDGHSEDEFFEETEPELTPESAGIAELATPDGLLNLEKTAAALDRLRTGLTTQTVYPPKKSCILFVCQGIRSGTLPRSKNIQYGAYQQYPGLFGRSGKFDFPTCVFTASRYDVDVPYLGCAPTAFVGMMKWYAANKGLKLFGTSSSSTIAYKMTAPLGLRGRPLIANYMGSCYNGGGIQTVGFGFRDGAKNFLRDQGSSLRMVSNISHGSGNVTSAPSKASILIRNIGERNRPVIAEYFTGLGKGHYSPVVDYAVYDSGTNGLNIRTVGDLQYSDYDWYSLSGTWGLERGVFALE